MLRAEESVSAATPLAAPAPAPPRPRPSPDGVVDAAVGEEIRAQRLLLDLPAGRKREGERRRGGGSRRESDEASPQCPAPRPARPTHLTSMARTLSASGKRSHTFPFIFSLTTNRWHVRQSPIFIAFEAATTCSRMDSGGPEQVRKSGFFWGSFFPPKTTGVGRDFGNLSPYPAAAASLRRGAGDGTAC